MSRRFLTLLWNRKQRRLRAGLRLALHLLLLVVLMFAALLPALLVMQWLDMGTDDALFLAVVGIAQSLAMALSVFMAYPLLDRRRSSSNSADLGFNHWSWLELWLGFFMGAVMMLLIFAIELRLGWIVIRKVGPAPHDSLQAFFSTQLAWLMLMIAVGYSEELLSRGYHLKNLAEGLRGLRVWQATSLAALLSSLFFGFLHATNDHATLVSSLGVAAAGLMLAFGRIATGSLAAPIGLHISWNWFQGPLLGFPVSGNAVQGSLVQLQQLGNPTYTGGEFGPEAGLLGIAAVVLLALLFWLWGIASGKFRYHATTLVHYRPPPRKDRSGTREPNDLWPAV